MPSPAVYLVCWVLLAAASRCMRALACGRIPHALTCPKVLGPQSTHKAIKTAMYSCVNWCGGKVAGGEPFLKHFVGSHTSATTSPAANTAAVECLEQSPQQQAEAVAAYSESTVANLDQHCNTNVAAVKNKRADHCVELDGKVMLVDYTVMSVVTKDRNNTAWEQAGATAKLAEEHKFQDYKIYTDSKPSAEFMPFGIESHGRLGPAAAAFLELMWEHVKSIKKGAFVPVKSRCMAVLSVGLFRAQARRLLHLSPAGAVFGAHMPAPPATGE